MTRWDPKEYRALLREHFTRDEWTPNEKRNYVVLLAGHRVTFFYNKAREYWQRSGWAWVCSGIFSQDRFEELSRAREDAFDALYPRIRNKIKSVLSKP